MVLSVTEALLVGASAQRGPSGWRLRKARAVRELGLCSAPGVPWGALAKLLPLLPGCFRGRFPCSSTEEARTLLAGVFGDPNLRSGTE